MLRTFVGWNGMTNQNIERSSIFHIAAGDISLAPTGANFTRRRRISPTQNAV
jgi:hypothetical protein